MPKEDTMSSSLLLYLGAVILSGWGVAHIIPTRNVVAGFGALSEDNRINITMEWVAEGLTLAFAGILTALVTVVAGPADSVARIVLWAIVVLAIRVCPLVMAIAAVLRAPGNTLSDWG
jgi:hypothetical protein